MCSLRLARMKSRHLVLAAPRRGKSFQGRREYVPIGSGENIHVFDSPGKPTPIPSLPIQSADADIRKIERHVKRGSRQKCFEKLSKTGVFARALHGRTCVAVFQNTCGGRHATHPIERPSHQPTQQYALVVPMMTGYPISISCPFIRIHSRS